MRFQQVTVDYVVVIPGEIPVDDLRTAVEIIEGAGEMQVLGLDRLKAQFTGESFDAGLEFGEIKNELEALGFEVLGPVVTETTR